MTNTSDDREDETNQIFHHFDNLLTALRQAFEVENTEQLAAVKIQRLKQTGFAGRYAAEFKTLVMQLS